MKQVAFIRGLWICPIFHSATKDKGLKISILYLHQKGIFEVWLSACKREISRIYNTIICEQNSHMNITHFQDQKNPDAILESTLITTSYL